MRGMLRCEDEIRALLVCYSPNLCSRELPRIKTFLASDLHKADHKWEAGVPYYESVKRTIPEIFN